MNKTWLRWLLAILITAGAAIYQRLTGPTYPVKGSVAVAGHEIRYHLPRSHGGEGGALVVLDVPDTTFSGHIVYRRYKSGDDWLKQAMQFDAGQLKWELPHQPPAGKLEYFVLLSHQGKNYSLPKAKSVVIRYKGAVPAGVLIPHIFFMFFAMLLSTFAGLEALVNGNKIKKYAWLAALALFIGGMILGPLVQKFAFDAYWTGVPFGWDLTDNKTLLAILGWLVALAAIDKKGQHHARWYVVAATVILLGVYSIPHSAMGSELDYKTMKVVTGK